MYNNPQPYRPNTLLTQYFISNKKTPQTQTEYILEKKQEKFMEVERAGARSALFARSRRGPFKKKFIKRTGYQPQISRALYGRETVVKLSYTKDLFTSLARLRSVEGLVAALRASNDYTNYSNSFQQFNILKVSMRILIGNTAAGTTALPSANVIGMAYSLKSDSVLSDLNQIADHEQYKLIGTSNADSSIIHQFKFLAKPNMKPPFSTNSSVENYGWVKFYSDEYGANTIFACKIIYTFTVCFSGEA